MTNMTRIAAALAVAFSAIACSGNVEEAQLEGVETAAPELSDEVRADIESRIAELQSDVVDKATPPCPQVSEIDYAVTDPRTPDIYEHLFAAVCSQNGNTYGAYLLDVVKDGTQIPSPIPQRGPFKIYPFALPNGLARAHVQNGDSGACPPRVGGSSGTLFDEDYGNCRPVTGIEVSVVQ